MSENLKNFIDKYFKAERGKLDRLEKLADRIYNQEKEAKDLKFQDFINDIYYQQQKKKK